MESLSFHRFIDHLRLPPPHSGGIPTSEVSGANESRSGRFQVGPRRILHLQSPFLFLADICCYILYSASLDKFYIGACQDALEERIRKHNEHAYGNHRFTAAAKDWQLFLKIEADSFPHAVRFERKIKSMNSVNSTRSLVRRYQT
ncbi:MAG: GIY-YIG nuclease family protein [Bacteroidota bacterium]|jgi:putative endonuclease